MKLITDFWSEKKYEFNNLLFVFFNGNEKKIIFKADLNNKINTINFFQSIIKKMNSKSFFKDSKNENSHYQFAVEDEIGKIIPIKWFDLIIGKNKISHDFAFDTTIIIKNNINIMLGKFPQWTKHRLATYRTYKIKKNAYRFIINQIKNTKE